MTQTQFKPIVIPNVVTGAGLPPPPEEPAPDPAAELKTQLTLERQQLANQKAHEDILAKRVKRLEGSDNPRLGRILRGLENLTGKAKKFQIKKADAGLFWNSLPSRAQPKSPGVNVTVPDFKGLWDNTKDFLKNDLKPAFGSYFQDPGQAMRETAKDLGMEPGWSGRIAREGANAAANSLGTRKPGTIGGMLQSGIRTYGPLVAGVPLGKAETGYNVFTNVAQGATDAAMGVGQTARGLARIPGTIGTLVHNLATQGLDMPIAGIGGAAWKDLKQGVPRMFGGVGQTAMWTNPYTATVQGLLAQAPTVEAAMAQRTNATPAPQTPAGEAGFDLSALIPQAMSWLGSLQEGLGRAAETTRRVIAEGAEPLATSFNHRIYQP